jgi:hypothetical protein
LRVVPYTTFRVKNAEIAVEVITDLNCCTSCRIRFDLTSFRVGVLPNTSTAVLDIHVTDRFQFSSM